LRTVAIYLEDDTPVTSGCIQTGETGVTRTSKSKFFEMSDGTCTCYPCQTAKAEMTLSLECTQAQADAIDAVSHCGMLLFQGIRFAAKNVTNSGTKYRAFIAGNVRIEEKFYKTGIYAVTIPLRFDVSGETYRTGATT
jgi:hypothetical protein